VPSNGPEIVRPTGRPGRQVIVIKMRDGGVDSNEIVNKVIDRLSGLGYEDFATDEVAFAGQQTTRLEFVYRGGDRPERRSWEYFAVRPPAMFCLGLGTYDWDADKSLLEQIAARFELTWPDLTHGTIPTTRVPWRQIGGSR
jgi:hypothetical protein